MTTPGLATLRIGRETCGVLDIAEQREWLVTNGAGAYGSGSVAGSLTRGYHGLLVAAVTSAVDRRIMLVSLNEAVAYRGATFELAAQRWASGTVAPAGHTLLESFELEGSVPLWRYACADATLEKRVWMERGANTTYVAYTLAVASEPVTLKLQVITDNRVFHDTGETAWPARVDAVTDGLRVTSGASDALPLVVVADAASVSVSQELYQDYYLPAEAERGLNAIDAHVHAGDLTMTLAPGTTVVVTAAAATAPVTAVPRTTGVAAVVQARRDRDASLLAAWRGASGASAAAPDWVPRLVLTADHFVIARPTAAQPQGRSVIAGYHWFEDWGRDTMIGLPGLTLVTGRAPEAATILRAFGAYVSEGMIPNRFPDGAATPDYNTIDATLWYVLAIQAYHDATGDDTLLHDLWPALVQIVQAHVAGTRYGIKVDPQDGLLAGGQPGVQLTWMDAVVDGRVITPRIGKPVEVNALWVNMLTAMAAMAERIGEPADTYRRQAELAATGFARFWNEARGYCFDVLDGPDGNDPALRPNQLIAISLPQPLLGAHQQAAVLDACLHALRASPGLRSLAPDDPSFVGSYAGDQEHRDGAYHQGTVWAWLIGPLVDAHLRVHGDPVAACGLLTSFGDHLGAAGIGSVSEIFDGNPPFAPRGCIAQAWSVGEVLRAFAATERFPAPAPTPH